MGIFSQNFISRQKTEQTISFLGIDGKPIRHVGGNFNCSFQEIINKFIYYIQYELNFSITTVAKYKDNLFWIQKQLPHVLNPSRISTLDITLLKQKIKEGGARESRINSHIFALRKFLGYCNTILKISTINPKEIKPMRIPKRQVVYLTKEEVHKLLENIKADTKPGLRMKALMAVLLASGMRISEALSLNKDDIDWENKETVIIGKGNKERTVYFNDESLGWLRAYLLKRNDANEALFVTFRKNPQRMKPYDLSKQFKHYSQKAGIKKKLTPHILRHTMATIMSINGADIRQIQQILGHSDIETTAKYYLGTDQEAVRQAHTKYLKY
jgi:integrase/recombinase XerD